MTTLPIRNLTTFWLQYGSSGITPFSQRIGSVVEGIGDQGMTVMTPSGRAGLDLVGDDLAVTGSNIHFWDASSIVGGVPQTCQKLAANNALHGAAPNAMYMRSTSDNGVHNHESMRWFFNGSTADNNNGNVAALNNFGVGISTDIWAATSAVGALSIANGTAPTNLANTIHLYSSGGETFSKASDGGTVQITNNPRWTKLTNVATGVQMDLNQFRSVPAVSDIPGLIRFRARNSVATEISYAEVRGSILDPTAATAAGRIEFWTSVAAVSAARAYVANGFMVGTTTDPGAGGIMLKPAASITPLVNGDLTFEATSNTSFTIKYKGSDGTVRTNVLTLA